MWTERSMFSHLWKWWWFVVLKDFRFWQKIILFLSFHKTDDFYKRDEYQDPFYLIFFRSFTFDVPDQSDCDYGNGPSVWVYGGATHSLGWVQKLFCQFFNFVIWQSDTQSGLGSKAVLHVWSLDIKTWGFFSLLRHFYHLIE